MDQVIVVTMSTIDVIPERCHIKIGQFDHSFAALINMCRG